MRQAARTELVSETLQDAPAALDGHFERVHQANHLS